MKLIKNTAGSGHNLLDDRSHKVQYIDPIIGYTSTFISMTHNTPCLIIGASTLLLIRLILTIYNVVGMLYV